MCACSVASSGVKNCQKRESAIRVKSRKSFFALGVIGRSYLVGMGSNPTRPTNLRSGNLDGRTCLSGIGQATKPERLPGSCLAAGRGSSTTRSGKRARNVSDTLQSKQTGR